MFYVLEIYKYLSNIDFFLYFGVDSLDESPIKDLLEGSYKILQVPYDRERLL